MLPRHWCHHSELGATQDTDYCGSTGAKSKSFGSSESKCSMYIFENSLLQRLHNGVLLGSIFPSNTSVSPASQTRGFKIS
jgi:hypothetical protein